MDRRPFAQNRLIMKNLLLGALALISFSACGTMPTEDTATQEAVEQVSGTTEDLNVERFAEFVASGEGIVLDVRTPDEYNAGHLEGSLHHNIYDADFADQLAKLDPETPVYVYCKAGGRSAKAMSMMHEMGFAEVYNLAGGYDAWSRSGQPVVK